MSNRVGWPEGGSSEARGGSAQEGRHPVDQRIRQRLPVPCILGPGGIPLVREIANLDQGAGRRVADENAEAGGPRLSAHPRDAAPERLVEAAHPRKIILFGSRARTDAGEDDNIPKLLFVRWTGTNFVSRKVIYRRPIDSIGQLEDIAFVPIDMPPAKP